jgi:hypothetical protein
MKIEKGSYKDKDNTKSATSATKTAMNTKNLRYSCIIGYACDMKRFA